MKKTDNYGLTLYDKEDKMSITAEENSLNSNMKIIDKTLKEKATINDMTKYIEGHKEELKGEKGDTGATGPQGIQGEKGPKGDTGSQGPAGKDGTNGIDGKDGYTPVKGVDYFDGVNGKDGANGKDGENGKDGAKGADGVSATHSWNGTTLTITSASGTSSADLKGEKGDTGANGKDGTDGVNGSDYVLTEADKTEIANQTKDLIPLSDYVKSVNNTLPDAKGNVTVSIQAEQPNFANSIEECVDTNKMYVLPDGYIYAYMLKTVTVPHNANDGTCVLNKRVAADSPIGTTDTNDPGCFATGPIQLDKTKDSFKVNFSGIDMLYTNFYTPIYTYYYKADGSWIGYTGDKTLGSGRTGDTLALPASIDVSLSPNFASASQIRIYCGITANSTITETHVKDFVINCEWLNTQEEQYMWASTGHLYQTGDYGQAIEQNTSDINTLKSDVEDLKEAVKTTPSQSGAVWYAVGDSITKGYGVTPETCWVSYVMKYNGYDKVNSRNLGISGLGFAKADPNFHKTARMVVDENDFTNVDLVTIAIGINDWKEPFSIDTVKSEMGYCFEKILTDNPYCKIIFIVPFNIWLKGNASTNWALGYSGSDVTGGTLQNFIDAQKSVCEEYGIQIIDMTNNSVINKVNIETVLYDKVHPDAECHIALGRELARRITYA